ncbi:hypothetical protein DPMN_131196 [Dreissena polymorpha]|uniref:G-protein coupled receptors family 1 profile domain-containing protein n=2 Tax=Dreissena polymorpha TaxID=45954 RepID=A0A9D4K280_DREPO|nr:hypothetical protein DPMN_131196 [Dreissena polymorpha]
MLVFTPSASYHTAHDCIYDNDSFTELLYEDFDSYVISPWQWVEDHEIDVLSIFIVLFAIATVVMNVCVIVTFVRQKILAAFNIILLGISVFDTLTVLVPAVAEVTVLFLGQRLPKDISVEQCQAWAYMTKYLPTIAHNASVWLTVGLAYDRYIVVKRPFISKRKYTRKRSVIMICVVFLLAVLSNLCRFFDTDYMNVKIVSAENVMEMIRESKEHNFENVTVNVDFGQISKELLEQTCRSSKGHTSCRAVYKPFFRDFKLYEFCFYWFVIIFVKFIPCITLLILDTLMLRALRKAEKLRHNISYHSSIAADTMPGGRKRFFNESRRMTVLLFVAIIIVAVVELPMGFVLMFWTLAELHGQKFMSEETLSDLSRTANICVYVSYPFIFLLYCCISAKFRAGFCRLCCFAKKGNCQPPSTCGLESNL